jgi:DnaJ family protein C protein 9
MRVGEQLEKAMGTRDLYEILELGEKREASSAEEIKRAYRKAALKHHPDKNGDAEKFKACSVAHSILSDTDKKSAYDETGDVDDAEGHDMDEKNFAEWDAYFRALYPKLTISKIDAFASSYKNGKEEREDLLKYYAQFHGDFKGIMSCVPLSEDRDIPRFCSIIDAAIESGELSTSYPKYREFKKKGIKSVVIDDDESDSGSEDEPATAAPASPKKKRAAPAKAKAGKIGKAKSQGGRKKSATKGDSENDLAALILGRRGAGSMIASIASKYGGCGGEGDIDDEAFAAAQAKVMGRSKKE